MERKVFVHVACMGNFEEVLTELCAALTASGLEQGVNEFTFIIAANEEVKRQEATDIISNTVSTDRSEMIQHASLEDFEFPTLQALYEYAIQNPASQVLYLHTKGVSKPSVFRKYWRRAMIDSMIYDHGTCWKKLENHDTVGFSWKGNHYCGNFWWANASVFNRFPGFIELRKNPINIAWLSEPKEKDRMQCEFFWIKMLGNFSPGNMGFIYHPDALYIDPSVKLDKVADPFDEMGIPEHCRYVINMAARPDRLLHWKAVMRGAGIRTESFTRMEGFPARSMGIDATGMKNYPLHERSAGMGCIISHWHIIQTAYEKEFPYLLVMEDDAMPVRGFYEYLMEQWTHVPTDFDMLWIGGYERHNRYHLPRKIEDGQGIRPKKRITEILHEPNDTWGTHCYVLSASGIGKVRNHLASHTAIDHIDIMLSRHVPGLKQYSFIPSLMKQDDSRSDIH